MENIEELEKYLIANYEKINVYYDNSTDTLTLEFDNAGSDNCFMDNGLHCDFTVKIEHASTRLHNISKYDIVSKMITAFIASFCVL